jgi:hypothetical protein
MVRGNDEKKHGIKGLTKRPQERLCSIAVWVPKQWFLPCSTRGCQCATGLNKAVVNGFGLGLWGETFGSLKVIRKV